MRGLLVLALAAPLLGAGPAIKAKPIAPGTFVIWNSGDGARGFTQSGVTATLSARADEDEPTLTVSAPGKTPLRFAVDGSMAKYVSIAIGSLTRGQPSSVVLQTYTGGAHCCARVIAVVPAGARFAKVDFGLWDGEPIDWPKDLNGNGVADFRFRDQHFLYAFGSYAGSWPPFKFMTIRGFTPVDISTDPAFRPFYAAELPKMRKACLEDDNAPDGGVCAGYLATAARLGRFNQAWASFLQTNLSKRTRRIEPCKGTRPDSCVSELASNIRAFLREQRYIK
jgi:hypothetical protein